MGSGLRSRRRVAGRAVGALGALLLVSGCAGGEGRDYAVPESLCGVPVSATALEELLPATGSEVEVQPVNLGTGSKRCKVLVDKRLQIYVTDDVVPADTDPLEVKARQLRMLGNPEPVDIGDAAQLADDGVLAYQGCPDASGGTGKAQPKYTSFVELIDGAGPDSVDERREALQALAEDYLPAAVRKRSCG